MIADYGDRSTRLILLWGTSAIGTIARILRDHLANPSSGFSLGAPGALAEFYRDPGETLLVQNLETLTLATERGGLRIDLSEDIQPIAHETLSRRRDRWNHGLALCRPAEPARGACRRVLTELGPDRSALRGAHCDQHLFDLGLGRVNVDFCIRTGDLALIGHLRETLSRSLLEPDNPTMGAIIAASPHRVVLSSLGRIEVTQAIGQSQTPEGPHTHVLPAFLGEDATHDPAIPIPEGMIPCLTLHPENPCFDVLGRDKPFDCAALDAFQSLLDLWGAAGYRTEKARALAAIKEGRGPQEFSPPQDEWGLTAVRIAMRQVTRTDPKNGSLAVWRSRFEPA